MTDLIGYVNEDAGLTARQGEDAITGANSALVTFGYDTPVVVFRRESTKLVPEQSRLVDSKVRRDCFLKVLAQVQKTRCFQSEREHDLIVTTYTILVRRRVMTKFLANCDANGLIPHYIKMHVTTAPNVPIMLDTQHAMQIRCL